MEEYCQGDKIAMAMATFVSDDNIHVRRQLDASLDNTFENLQNKMMRFFGEPSRKICAFSETVSLPVVVDLFATFGGLSPAALSNILSIVPPFG